MKKILFFLTVVSFVILINGQTFSQILNPGFENWTDLGPEFWSTINIPGLYVSTTKSSDAHGGSSSAKLEIVNYFNSPYPGELISDDSSGAIGHPVTSKYNSLIGYYKSDLKGTSLFYIIVYMLDENENLIGAGEKDINTSNSSWTQFNVPIDYVFDTAPAYCRIHFLLGDSTSSSDLSSVGSYVLIDDISLDEVTAVNSNENIPTDFSLSQNYPNPFNPSTVINFSNPEASNIKIDIYNSIGQEVNTLINKEFDSGFHEITWNAGNLPSGIYFIRINAKSTLTSKIFTDVKKAILMR